MAPAGKTCPRGPFDERAIRRRTGPQHRGTAKGAPNYGCTGARTAETLRFYEGRRARPVNLIVRCLALL